MFKLNGYTVIASPHILDATLKYPTGYKDGNKLGRRKRTLKKASMIISGEVIYCSPNTYETLKNTLI